METKTNISREEDPKRSVGKLLFTKYTTNDGTYGRAIDEELKARIGFELSSFFINFLYVLQILVAATITGLASYPGYHVALTVLGAINTVLAGLMAYVKGQGMPNRMLKSRDQFQKIIKCIEDQEREFSRFAYMSDAMKKTLDPFKEADKLQQLFDAAKRDQQDNYPDLYLNNHERAATTAINEGNREDNATEGKDRLTKRIAQLEKMLETAKSESK